MGKAAKEYKKGDFIFAKVKGYPAWPARVRAVNGKKYFVFFYGTGETANLAANVLFDYAENKDKLTKNVKRKFFTEGVQQIDYDFTNNVPLEDDGAIEAPANDSMDDSGTADTTADETADDSAMDTTAADTTAADESAVGSQNSTAVEDSDEGPLVIDEGKKTKKERKKSDPSTPKATKDKTDKPDKSSEKDDKAAEKETPAAKEKETPAKEPRTPRIKREKETPVVEKEKEKEEIVSRSGRKIRPKRYIDEVTEESPLAPATKKRRAASSADKEPEKREESERPVKFNFLSQTELQELTEPPSEAAEQYEDVKKLILEKKKPANESYLTKKRRM